MKPLKKLLHNSALLYAFVGVINTIVGYGIMYTLAFLGIMPEIANAIGYIIGILSSYILNKKITFKSKNSHAKDFSRFVIAMLVAYIANLLVLVLVHRVFGISEYIAFIISGGVYTLVGYLISKFWAFKQ